eukprot:TRINITY_DN7401_c0_g1_i1.p1 TRINITY_DN7401_c0_g1~~TRINITY_DN7401_c0_g1_i1.p1  ORF type:complete len:380 (-),score=162.35 TRINITY_DN7401_c0_g1_i1:469-1608(-)
MLNLLILALVAGVAESLHFPPLQKGAGTPPWDCSDSIKYNASADGYRWNPGYNVLKVEYSEWWFFTLIDPVNNLAMAYGYAVHDPDNVFGKGMSGLSSMVYEKVYGVPELNITTLNDDQSFKLDSFHATPDNATLSVGGGNTITVIDAQTYQVVGGSANGATWNLTYVQLADAMQVLVQAPGVLELDWISYMPGAVVNGLVTFNGRTYQVKDAVGYHDHNFGFWPQPLFNWIWANYNGRSNTTGATFAMVMGAYKIPETNDTYIGYVLVRYGGQHIEFGTMCGDSFELVPQEFVPWPGRDGKTISVHNIMATHNHKYRLVVEYKTRVWSLNPAGLDMGLLVSEQISAYHVQLFQASGNGWSLLDELTGEGFNEWCDTII